MGTGNKIVAPGKLKVLPVIDQRLLIQIIFLQTSGVAIVKLNQ